MNESAVPELLDRAAAAIGEDGDLPVATRAALQVALRRIDPTRWARLELTCAAHVLPIWFETYGAAQPADVLALAERAVDDPRLFDDLREAADQLDLSLNNMPPTGPDEDAAHTTGWTVRQAAWAVVMAGPIQPGESASQDEDPWDWSAAFSGSIAWARGATWETDGKTGDPVRRREYWLWYLNTAIPGIFK